jgi:hypothetical protein
MEDATVLFKRIGILLYHLLYGLIKVVTKRANWRLKLLIDADDRPKYIREKKCYVYCRKY